MRGIRSRPRQSPCSAGTNTIQTDAHTRGKHHNTPGSAKVALFYKPPFQDSDPHTPTRTLQIKKRRSDQAIGWIFAG